MSQEIPTLPEKVRLDELGIDRSSFIARLGANNEVLFLHFRTIILKELNSFIESMSELLLQGVSVEFRIENNWLQYKVTTREEQTSWLNVVDLKAFVNNVLEEYTMTFGSKYSALDAGLAGQLSFDDDFIYVCVESGDEGNARWKRSPIKTI